MSAESLAPENHGDACNQADGHAAGGTDPNLCAPFTRGAGGQLNPPKNFLQNLAQITTDGEDIKATWLSAPTRAGHFSVAVQATRVNKYEAVDTLSPAAE